MSRFQARPLFVLLVGVLAGLVLGLIFASLQYHPSQISKEFREAEVAEMFRKYKEGRILHKVKIRLLSAEILVSIVDSTNGADYGFVTSSDPFVQCWIVNDMYTVKRFDSHTLLVIVSDSIASKLERF